MFPVVAGNLVSLCSLMLIGLVAGKVGLIDERLSKGLGGVLLNIALPCAIIMSMQREFSAELLSGGLLAMLASAAIYLSSFGLGWVWCKVMKIGGTKRKIWLFAVMFPNVGYMGFPVLSAVYGDGALFYVSMCNVAFNLLSTTVGIAVMKGKNSEKGKFAFPLLPAVTAVGFALFAARITIPAPIARALTMGGNMMTPLSMIIIGGLLSRSKPSAMFGGLGNYVLALSRLLLLPVAVWAVMSPFVADKLVLGTVVLLTGMPVAAVTAIYAQQFANGENGEGEDCGGAYASEIVAMTTVLSLLSLPVLSLLL